MAKHPTNMVKLGTFVMAGLLFLVFLLYMIGKNRSLFGSTYPLKARFENVQGLVTGNNVRFSGIQAGTVKKIKILNDTTIEVTMYIEEKMKSVIRKNAMASIGTEGLVGNKVVNISPSHSPGDLAEENDLLVTRKTIDTDVMLETLSRTNQDVADIAANLKITVLRLNNSSALWELLGDNTLPMELRASVANIRSATHKAGLIVADLHEVVAGVKNGKGSVGALITDTAFAVSLNQAVEKINIVGERADSLAIELSRLVGGLQNDIDNGKGTLHTLLKDTILSRNLNASLENIRKGTDGFNQNMEALKNNFLFRGYFRKQERLKKAGK